MNKNRKEHAVKSKINSCFEAYYKALTTVNILLFDIKKSLPPQNNISQRHKNECCSLRKCYKCAQGNLSFRNGSQPTNQEVKH